MAELVSLLTRFKDQGYQPAQLAKQLAAHLREQLITGNVPFEVATVRTLLHGLLEIPAAHDPAAGFELLLIDQVIDRAAPTVVLAEEITATEVWIAPPAEVVEPRPKPKAKKPEIIEDIVADQVVPEESAESEVSSPLTTEIWMNVLNEIKKTHNTLYGIARMAQPRIEGDTLTLCFSFPFHQKRINEAKNKQIINDVINNLTGSNVTIVCIVDKDFKAAPLKPVVIVEPSQPRHNDTVSTISNIFGGAEILE